MKFNVRTLPIILAFILLSITWIFSFDYPLSTFIFHNILPYDQKRILQIFLLSSTAIVFIFSPYREVIIKILNSMQRSSKIALFAFLYLGLVSAIFAKIPMAGFLEWSLDILLIFFALCWATIALQLGEKFYYLFSGLVFLIIAFYVYPVCVSYAHVFSDHMTTPFFPYFINERFFAQFSSMTLALLPLPDIYLQNNKRFTFLRPLLFLLAGFWWALIILNGSRGVACSFIITFVIACIIFKKTLAPWIWRQSIFIVTGVFCLFLFSHAHIASQSHAAILANVEHLKTFNHVNVESRIILYQYALQLTAKHPWLGVGPMHFAYTEPTILIKAHQQLAAHPHNFILLFLSEWGIPAFIFLLFFMTRVIFNFIKTAYVARKNIIYASFGMALGCGLLDALVSGVMVMPLSQTLLSVIVGACIALYYQHHAPVENNVSSFRRNGYFVAMLIVMGFSVYIAIANVIATAPILEKSEILWLEKHGLNTQFNPRFWLQGWLDSN